MSDGFLEWEWEYTTLVGYPKKGGLDKFISVMMRRGWEVVEGTRTPPEEKASPGKSISDGSIQMRRKVPTVTTTQMGFNLGEPDEDGNFPNAWED
jgi:hypothetical protein